MNRFLSTHSRTIFTCLFGMAAILFFGYFCQYHLMYIEGMQLFLYTGEYFQETLIHPGGVADLFARFLTQFYHFPLVGGVIIALLLILFQSGIWGNVKNITATRKQSDWWLLTFIPPAAYWYLLCDFNYTLTGLAALTIVVWVSSFYSKLHKTSYRAGYVLIVIPLLWLAVGGAAAAAVLLMAFAEVLMKPYRKWLPFSGIVLGILFFLFIFFTLPIQNEPLQLFFGGLYYRYLKIPLFPYISMWTLTALVTAVAAVLPEFKKQWIHLCMGAIMSAALFFVICLRYDRTSEREYMFLFATKQMKWQQIIKESRKQLPNSLVAVNMLNLALAMTDSSGDDLFNYPQPSQGALILSYNQDMLYAQEILFNLGLINESRRYAFECLSQIPDRQQSAYFIMRLAESDMISGRDTLARKYLNTLNQTLFYKKWAQRRLFLLNTENGVDNHPVYGSLRKMQPKRNFNYTVLQFGQMLRNILEDNPRNHIAYNYLMMYYMLTKNIPAFCENLQIVDPLPRHYQEVLALTAGHSESDTPEFHKLPMDDQVFLRFKQFEKKLQAVEPGTLDKEYGNTFWYYFYMIK